MKMSKAYLLEDVKKVQFALIEQFVVCFRTFYLKYGDDKLTNDIRFSQPAQQINT